MKQRIIPIVSVVAGLLGFLLTINYWRGQEARYKKMIDDFNRATEKIFVMVAKNDIPEGSKILATDIVPEEFPRIKLPKDAVTKEDAKKHILGRKMITTINKGEILCWSHVEGGTDTGVSLSSVLTPGMRAVSLPVGGAEAVSGLIHPADRVDVLGTFSFPSKKVPGEMEAVTLTVLQDVTVLATGQRMAKATSREILLRASGYNSVTLEVTPREAEVLVFAQQMKGRLTLSLRNRDDATFEKDLPEIDFEHIEKRLPELNMYRQRNVRHKRD